MKSQVNFSLLPLAARWAIVVFGAIGLTAAGYALLIQPVLAPSHLLFLMALAAATARAKVNLYRGTSLSFLTVVVLLAIITQGPGVAVLVAVFGVTVQSFLPKRKLVLHQAVFNAGMISMTVMLTWWTHYALTAILPLAPMSAETTATLLSSFTYFVGNSVSVSLMVGLSKGISIIQVWSQHFLYSAPSFMIAGILSLGLMAFGNSATSIIVPIVVSITALSYYCAVRMTTQTAS